MLPPDLSILLDALLPQASHLLMRPQSLQGQTSMAKGGVFRRPSSWDRL